MFDISFVKDPLNQDTEMILKSYRNNKNYDSNDTVFNPGFINQKPLANFNEYSCDLESKENYDTSLSFFKKGPNLCPSPHSCNFKNDFDNQKDIIENSLNGINNTPNSNDIKTVEVKNNHVFENGDVYTGQFYKNMPHGNGIYTSTETNTLYKGKFHYIHYG